MKKSFLVVFSLIALTGILFCAVAEPAIDSQRQHATCQSASSEDKCMTCYSVHHQWIHSSSYQSVSYPIHESSFLAGDPAFPDSLANPFIFHPPLAV